VADKTITVWGPEILARTLSRATARGANTRPWQYHSRSDRHSKVACWTLMFDLLMRCDVLRAAAAAGKVGFDINHVMVGPINKTLDLVVTWNPVTRGGAASFRDLVEDYGIVLNATEQALLVDLPTVPMVRSEDMPEVAIALEAKACMTAHVKSLPRLHAEILATGYLAKKAARRCISVSYSLVNAATTFVTPSHATPNAHNQPSDARSVVEMIRSAVPMNSDSNDYGYDAIGITVIDCRNDGSPVTVVEDPAIGPGKHDHTHYERMLVNLCALFRARFAG
jgi:hypothetical protein